MGDTGQDYLYHISDGRAGVKETLDIMAKLAREYSIVPRIILTSRMLLSGVPPKAWKKEIRALFNFVQKHIRYTRDTSETELLMTPTRLLDIRSGDCDDKSLLLATLLLSIDHPVRFKAVGFEPGVLSHVYVQAKCGADWIALDATENFGMGWEPPDIRDLEIVHI